MVYKYLLVHIHSSHSFFWVGFISCVSFFFKKNFMAPFYGWVSTASRLQSHDKKALYFVPIKLLPTIFQYARIDSKFWKIHLSWMCVEHKWFKGIGYAPPPPWVCTCTWYEVEIRFSDNLRQKETIDDIIWLRRKKSVIYRLDIIFSTTQCGFSTMWPS